MKLRHILSSVALTGVLASSVGCGSPSESSYIEGIVTEEYGTIVDRQKALEASEEALFGNDSVRIFDPTYGVKYRNTADGQIYDLGIVADADTLETFNSAIEPGTRIRVRSRAIDRSSYGTASVVYARNVGILHPSDES